MCQDLSQGANQTEENLLNNLLFLSCKLRNRGQNGNRRISPPISLQFWREKKEHGTHFEFLLNFLSLLFSSTNQTGESPLFYPIFSSPFSFPSVFFATKQGVNIALPLSLPTYWVQTATGWAIFLVVCSSFNG